MKKFWWKVHDFLYEWVDNRGKIPRWLFRFYPYAHWCPEMDELLILGNTVDCFCDHLKYVDETRGSGCSTAKETSGTQEDGRPSN